MRNEGLALPQTAIAAYDACSITPILHRSYGGAMAIKKKFPRISEGDIEILSMPCDHGPLTLPEAHARFGQYRRPVADTTIQTRLCRLFEKGALRRRSLQPARLVDYNSLRSLDTERAKHMETGTRGSPADGSEPSSISSTLLAQIKADRPEAWRRFVD